MRLQSHPEHSDRGAMANEVIQGGERPAYVALHRQLCESVGSPTGREPYGDGAPVVVRGRESRPHGEGGQVDGRARCEVREMRNAEAIRAIHQERGAKGLPLERVYRHLFDPGLYLEAYD